MKKTRVAALLALIMCTMCVSCTRGEPGEVRLGESETAEETAVFIPYDKTQPEVVCRVIRGTSDSTSGSDGDGTSDSDGDGTSDSDGDGTSDSGRVIYEIISPERSRGIRVERQGTKSP